jgi:hypothetical protein
MVGHPEVAELMDDHVAQYHCRREHQPPVERKVATG